jgi:hopanoid C-3 methylase
LHDYKPDLVGFGGFSSQFQTNRELAGITRKILPEALTCLGGIHPSSIPLDCKYPELFDFIVRGDGVSAMKKVIAALEKDEPLPESECIIPTSSSNFEKLASLPPPPLNPEGITTRPRRDLVKVLLHLLRSAGGTG